MPRYYYFCEDCEVAAAKIKGEELTYDEEWEVIFETFHLKFRGRTSCLSKNQLVFVFFSENFHTRQNAAFFQQGAVKRKFVC